MAINPNREKARLQATESEIQNLKTQFKNTQEALSNLRKPLTDIENKLLIAQDERDALLNASIVAGPTIEKLESDIKELESGIKKENDAICEELEKLALESVKLNNRMIDFEQIRESQVVALAKKEADYPAKLRRHQRRAA